MKSWEFVGEVAIDSMNKVINFQVLLTEGGGGDLHDTMTAS